MNVLLRDFRYSVRVLLKSPIFSIAVVASLAIGIAANAAIFSLVDGVLLKPLPFKDAERLVSIWEQPSKLRLMFASASGANYKDWKEQGHLFESLSAYTDREERTLIGEKGAERVGVRRVSSNMFATLQVSPVLGRWFANDEVESGDAHVAIISDSLWRRLFGGRADVVGKEIFLDRQAYSVVGVSPRIFESMSSRSADVLLLLNLNAKDMALRDMHLLNVIGRLRPGVTLTETQAEMDVIAARVATQYSNVKDAPAIKVLRPGGLTVLWYQGLLVTFQAAVLFVLLIACTNVASLLLARWTGRQQELAIRAALGATRLAIIRLSLCESIILVSSGTLLGVWLADVFRRIIVSVAPADIPRISEVQIDFRVLVGIIAVSVCLAIFFTLVPFLFSRRTEINDWLRQGGRAATAGFERQRLRSLLIILQVVLSVVLLSGAGLFLRSLWRLQKTDLGFSAEDLLTLHLFPDSVRYPTPEEVAVFYTLVLDSLNAIPGVGETCAVSHPPFSRGAMGNRVGIPGRAQNPGGRLAAQSVIVTPEYFRTLGIKVINGRTFTDRDTQGSPAVAVINQNLARQVFPSENPLGKQLEIEAAQFPSADNVQPRTAEVIGVVPDTKQFALTMPPHNMVYVPFAQNPARSMFLAAKTQIPSFALVEAVRTAVSKLDPDQPVYDVQMMTERVRASQSERHFNATLLVLFAALGLVATSIGIYGTLAFWVAQRTHEIGVRMALGAGKREIVSLVVGKVVRMMIVGVAVGLLISVGMVRIIRATVYQGQPGADIFYGVSSVDPVVMLSMLGVLIGSAALAALVPTRRATRIDPARVLQTE